MQHHSHQQSGSGAVSEWNWADRISSTTNYLDSNTAEIPEMQQPWGFFQRNTQKSIKRTFLQCTIPKQTSFPHHSSQLWEIWNKHFQSFYFFLFVLVLFYSLKMSWNLCLFNICFWLLSEMIYQSILEKVHDHVSPYPNSNLKMWRPRLICSSRGINELHNAPPAFYNTFYNV